VFIDVDTISPGSDFADAIDRAVRQCDAVVAVIGRHWLDAALPDGRRRLDEPNDFVRIELERAFANGVSLIPTVVQGAAFPDASTLPAALEPLAQRQGIELRDTAWRVDVQRLIRRLDPPRRRHRGRLLLLAGVAAAVAAIVAAVLALTLNAGGDSPSASLDPELLSAVSGGVSPSCQASSHGDYPASAKASIQCFGPFGLTATYNRFANTSVMNQWYDLRREAVRVAPSGGRCKASSFRGEGQNGDGRYLCYLNKNGEPWLIWTDAKLKTGSWAYLPHGTGSGAAASLLNEWQCCFKLKHEAALPSALVGAP
jgi:TIR domain